MPKAFTGRRPFSEFTTTVVTSKIVDGERPARPQEVEELGLTDPVWNMTVRCWLKDPTQRPAVAEVIGILQEFLVYSLSIEATLRDFISVCGTLDEDNQGKTAQEFADRLDEVRHAERHNIRSTHRTSRSLKNQIFKNKDASNI